MTKKKKLSSKVELIAIQVYACLEHELQDKNK